MDNISFRDKSRKKCVLGDDVIQLWPQVWEKSKLSQGRLSQGSLRVLSQPLGKSITHCLNCDSCCRNLIVGAFCRGSSQWIWTLFLLPGVCSLVFLPLHTPRPQLPSSNSCSSLHLCTAYKSAESHSSSFAGVCVLSTLALIMLYFILYICSTFNLL